MAEETEHNNLCFEIENLGPIARAEIELRPLTLFVGENNSGKSYLATAVWALHNVHPRLFNQPGHPAWEAALEQARRLLAQVESGEATRGAAEDGNPPFVLREPVTPSYSIEPDWSQWSGELRDGAAEAAVAACFRGGTLRPTVHVVGSPAPSGVAIRGLRLNDLDRALVLNVRGSTLVLPKTRPNQLAETCLSTSSGLGDGRTLARKQVIYLPSSRTGYIHLLPEIAERVLSRSMDLVGDDGPSPDAAPLQSIPSPTKSFFSFLVDRSLRQMSTRRSPSQSDLLQILETQILRGRIVYESEGGASGEVRYQPSDSGLRLPLAHSSALVSELMPFAEVLRGPAPFLLIYEEPEICLHPRIQRILAQILVRLIRRGTRVLITTHSDTLVQQFNNFMKLGALGADQATRDEISKETDNLSYSDEDYLKPEDVAAYEFQFRPDGRTDVARAEVRPDGMVLPSFNREIIRQVSEALELDKRLPEEA